MKTLYTKRLILRAWTLDDVQDLFEYAKCEDIGPMAGWKPHDDINDSRQVVQMFINNNEYAICYRENNKVIGSIGCQVKSAVSAELGFVLSNDYRGRGLMVEAAREYIKYLFNDLGYTTLYVGHFDFNHASKRVIEKLNFRHIGQSTYERKFDNAVLNKEDYIMTQQDYILLSNEVI